MKPQVSICIPTYKQVTFLQKCLNSILIQDFDDYEIIVTDDSPDNSVRDLLSQYDFNGKLIYKQNIPALGSPQNWNAGFEMAKGKYIKILHHDDWFSGKSSLREYVKLLDENAEADFGFSACIWVYPDIDKQKRMVPSAVQISNLRKSAANIFPENFVSTPSTIIIRNNENKQLFDSNIKWLVDSEYYFRCLMQNGNFAYTDTPLVNILIEAAHQVTSETRGNRATEIKEWVYFYNKIRERKPFNLNNYLHLKNVFKNFDIRNEGDLLACGVTKISNEIKSILLFKQAKESYHAYLHNGQAINAVKNKLAPKGSRRAKAAQKILFPLSKIKDGLKNKFLKSNTVLSEHFTDPLIVDVVNPVVRGFEIDNNSYNYGSRITIQCEKTDVERKAYGRWQINWLDGNNNFVFATYIPFELNNGRDKYVSPLITDVPAFVKRGILYLTSHDNNKIKIHSFSFSLYSIKSKPLKTLLNLRRINKKPVVKVKQKQQTGNILFIIPWMSVGGGDMVNLTIMKHLAKKGYNLHVFTSERSKNEWKSRFEAITRNIVVLPAAVKAAKSHNDYIDILISYIKAANIESIIISNSEFGYNCLPVVKNEFPQLKIVDILHGQGGEKEGGGFPEYSKSFDNYLDRRITINKYLKTYLTEKYNVRPDKITVIPNCIDTQVFVKKNKASNDVFTISFIGRLSYEKHPEKVVEIAALLMSRNPGFKINFQVIGDGPLSDELKASIIEKGVQNYVELKGYRANVADVLEQTDLLILCSEMEGLPIVLLEAMSMSVPCIASNVGGIPELIDDSKNGYLVDYNESIVLSFVEKIELIYNNPALRKELSLNARKKIETEYSIARMINGYLSVLNEKKTGHVKVVN